MPNIAQLLAGLKDDAKWPDYVFLSFKFILIMDVYLGDDFGLDEWIHI